MISKKFLILNYLVVSIAVLERYTKVTIPPSICSE